MELAILTALGFCIFLLGTILIVVSRIWGRLWVLENLITVLRRALLKSGIDPDDTKPGS